MSNNSSITLFHPNIGTKILLTGFLHAFSVSSLIHPPGLTKSLLTENIFAPAKTTPSIILGPFLGQPKYPWMFFGSAVFGDTALFSIPFLAASWEKL